MIRWTSTRPAPPPQRWQSREEILKAHLDSLSPLELLRVRPDLYALTWGWDFENKGYASGRLALYEELERRAGFNPNQPRVPAGNSDGGQWTDAGGGQSTQPARNDSTDFSAVRRRGPRDLLPFPHFSPPRDSGTSREPVTIVNNAQTGMSTVDEATEKLRVILENVVNSRPQGFGPAYGREIHIDFANAVKSADLPGIGRKGVEQSFDVKNPDVRYGSKESVRTDIVLRGEVGDVRAIYDVKTGNAYLDGRRVQELRDKTGVIPSVPIIEMHILRGLSLKARVLQPRYFWVVTLRLWNPWIRDIPGSRAAGAVASALRSYRG